MPAIVSLLIWIGGASAAALVYWLAAVYLFDAFDRGYGRLAYFQLNLYLAMISVVAGVLGYAVCAGFRRWPGSIATVFLAGVAFTVCTRFFTWMLGSIYPDRDMTIQGLAGALAIGAISSLAARRYAPSHA